MYCNVTIGVNMLLNGRSYYLNNTTTRYVWQDASHEVLETENMESEKDMIKFTRMPISNFSLPQNVTPILDPVEFPCVF